MSVVCGSGGRVVGCGTCGVAGPRTSDEVVGAEGF